MKKSKYIIISLLLAVSVVFLPGCQTDQSSDAELSALIVTGQNNHNWQASSPVLKDILENSGLFAVDIATSPAAGEDMSGFNPTFSDYDVVVLDYTGDAWSETTKTAGGWGDRNEKDGPYVYWKDGAITKDMSPGRGGSHGAQHAFQVVNRVTDHPITKGLPDAWMHGQDELYSQLRGPAENLTVLSTAYADSTKGGTGHHEPILMVINYGQGRIFHTVIGHAGVPGTNPAMECVGFIVTLQRGAEWAATGSVTQEVPEEFPSANVLSSWDKYRPYTVDELLECLEDFHKGDSRKCLQDMNNAMRKAASDMDKLADIEKKIIKFLDSKASNDAKNELCRNLSQWGSEASLPVLDKLMENDDTKEMARYARERISGEYSN